MATISQVPNSPNGPSGPQNVSGSRTHKWKTGKEVIDTLDNSRNKGTCAAESLHIKERGYL